MSKLKSCNYPQSSQLPMLREVGREEDDGLDLKSSSPRRIWSSFNGFWMLRESLRTTYLLLRFFFHFTTPEEHGEEGRIDLVLDHLTCFCFSTLLPLTPCTYLAILLRNCVIHGSRSLENGRRSIKGRKVKWGTETDLYFL